MTLLDTPAMRAYSFKFWPSSAANNSSASVRHGIKSVRHDCHLRPQIAPIFGSRTVTLEAGTIEADLVTLGDGDVGWDQRQAKTTLESISIGGHSLRHRLRKMGSPLVPTDLIRPCNGNHFRPQLWTAASASDLMSFSEWPFFSEALY
jgi:hypothetical protein